MTNSARKRLVDALYAWDLKQRHNHSSADWPSVQRADDVRGRFASAILACDRGRNRLAGREAFRLGIMLQHAERFREALVAANAAKAQSHTAAVWLLAAIYDRRAMILHGAQLYGTQFELRDGLWAEKPMLPPTFRRRQLLQKVRSSWPQAAVNQRNSDLRR